jgi:hypothetical protein
MIKHSYINICNQLLMCDGVISEHGEIIKVTSSDKLILSLIHQRIEFFRKTNQECFDSQEYIALRTGSNVKTVERCIIKFHKHGLLLAEKRFDVKTKHKKWFWFGFNIQQYVLLDGDKIKEFVSQNMKDYEPRVYYKHKESEPLTTDDESDYFSSRGYVDPEHSDEWVCILN